MVGEAPSELAVDSFKGTRQGSRLPPNADFSMREYLWGRYIERLRRRSLVAILTGDTIKAKMYGYLHAAALLKRSARLARKRS